MDIVEELDGFVNYLHGHRGDPKRLCNNAASEIMKLRSQVSALQAENEGMRKDAARYRKVCAGLDMDIFISRIANDEGAPGAATEQISSIRALDEYIDSLSGGDA